MKNNSLPKFSKISFIIASALAGLFILLSVLKHYNVYLYLFGISTKEILWIITFPFVALVLAAFAVWLFKRAKNKILRGLSVFLSVSAFVCISLVLFAVILFSPSGRYYNFRSDDGKHEIVVHEKSLLLYGGGDIYEKTSFCTMQRVGGYGTDDGYLPFTDGKFYFVWYADSFELHYFFGGIDDDGYNTVEMRYAK